MPTLSETINSSMEALLTRLNTLIATGNATELTLAAKALEAIRGTSALQNILQQSQDTLGALQDALNSAQSGLTSSKDTHLAALVSLKNTLAGNLTTLESTIYADFLSESASIGTPRVGDIFLSILPDPNILPDKVKICDGSILALAFATPLINAWGLGNGQTPCPFVVNYNASVSGPDQIIIDDTGLHLPNFAGTFFKAGAPNSVGQFQGDLVGPHTHGATQPFAISQSGSGVGVNTITNGAFRLDRVNATNNPAGAETRPKNFSAISLVRYK